MLRKEEEPFYGRIDDVSRRHVCESDGRQLLFARRPRLGANESGASVNDDGEAGPSEEEVHCGHQVSRRLLRRVGRGGLSRQVRSFASTCPDMPGMPEMPDMLGVAEPSATILSFWLA